MSESAIECATPAHRRRLVDTVVAAFAELGWQ